MPPFLLDDIAFNPISGGRRRRRGINTSGGIRPEQRFEDRFAQSQRPFDDLPGPALDRTFLGQFRGITRGAGGQFDFSQFDRRQRQIARGTAFDQFLNPVLSGQQQEAVEAVQRNRVARGLRGAAAEAAASSTAERFLAGNRRSALDFIRQDVGIAPAGRNPATAREGVDVENFLARSAAFNVLSRLRTQFDPGLAERRAAGLAQREFEASGASSRVEELRGIGGGGVAVEQQALESQRAQRQSEITQELLGQQTPEQLQPFLEDFDRIVPRGVSIQDAARDPNLDLGGGALDELVSSVARGFSPDAAVGGPDATTQFAEAFGLDPGQLGDLFPQLRTPDSAFVATARGSGEARQARRQRQTVGGRINSFVSSFGGTPGVLGLGDIQERINTFEQARTQGDIRNTQAGVTIAGPNRRLQGDEAQLAAIRELGFLRSQQSQLEQLRSTLFSPFSF